jgi:hypothetical protein
MTKTLPGQPISSLDIRHSSFSPNVLLASPRISHRGKALAKFSLLTVRFPLLLRLARLLLGTWTWGAAA